VPRYNPARDITPAFVDRVADWISTHSEVFVVVRWVGGFRDFALCRSRADFERIVEIVHNGTELVVFRDRQLPIRGRVNEEFIARALGVIPDGVEYLVITSGTKPDCCLSAGANWGESHTDLQETLRDWLGVEVAAGLCPDFWGAEHEGMISRAKGGVEGPR